MRRVWFLITGLGLLGAGVGCHCVMGACDCTCIPTTCVYGPLGTPAGTPTLSEAPIAGHVTVVPGSSTAAPMPKPEAKPETKPENAPEPKPDK